MPGCLGQVHPCSALNRLARSSKSPWVGNLESRVQMQKEKAYPLTIKPVRGVNESQHASFLSSPQEK